MYTNSGCFGPYSIEDKRRRGKVEHFLQMCSLNNDRSGNSEAIDQNRQSKQ